MTDAKSQAVSLCALRAVLVFTCKADAKTILERFPQVERRDGCTNVRITLRQPAATAIYHPSADSFQVMGLRSEAELALASQNLLKLLRLAGYPQMGIKSLRIQNLNFQTDFGFKVALDKLAVLAHGVYNPETSPGCVLSLALGDKESCTAQVFFSGKAQLNLARAELIDTALAKLRAVVGTCRVL